LAGNNREPEALLTCFPRQRHRTAHSLLHRGEIKNEFEKTPDCVSRVAGGMM